MPLETSYPGIYRGYVIDTNDPQKAGRARIVVPQVLGEEITTWAWPIAGVPENRKVPNGSFVDYDITADNGSTNSQTSSTSAQPIRMNTTLNSYAVSIANNDSGVPTRMTFTKAGLYNIQFSAQVHQVANGTPTIDFWLRQNGVDVPQSNGTIDLSNQNHFAVPSWNIVQQVNAGDYVEFMWASTSTVYLTSYGKQTNPTVPSTPDFAATATLVGGFLPTAGDPCWVMFEGGDPNFPLWLGTF